MPATLGTGTTATRVGTTTTRTTVTRWLSGGIEILRISEVLMVFNVKLDDMYRAYTDCRKRKKNTSGAKQFELYALYNIVNLTNEINAGKYKLKASTCFVVKYPKAREVFCASFRDRVVQHFIYNELNPVVEKMLIRDTASCRKDKGTDYAIKRVSKFLRRETENYTENAYIAKLDLSGFFMNIDRDLLLDLILDVIWNKYDGEYKDVLDYLCRIVVLTDVTKGAVRISPKSDWDLIPAEKSLFGRKYGIAIGNITSQMFANLYLNDADHYIKSRHKSACRYVDDIIIIDKSKDKLLETIDGLKEILAKYNQRLNEKKSCIRKSDYGVTFLGIDIKPYYNAHSKSRINRMFYTSRGIKDRDSFISSASSRKGTLKRYKGHHVFKRWFESIPDKLKEDVHLTSGYKIVDTRKAKSKELIRLNYGGCYVSNHN